MYISIEFGSDPIFLKKIGHVLIPLWSDFEIEFSKQHKSGFRKFRKLDSTMGTRQKHPISMGVLLLVCSTWVSMFGTTPNCLCAILFCFSDAPPTHLRRTSNAPATHLCRTCDALRQRKKIIWGVGVSGILPGGDVYHSPILFT